MALLIRCNTTIMLIFIYAERHLHDPIKQCISYSRHGRKMSKMREIRICGGIFTKWLFIHCFLIELEFRSVDFCGGRKTGEPGEKPSDQGREPTTISTHMGRRVRESNLGYIGGRRALSPLRHLCSIQAPGNPTYIYDQR